MKKNSNKRRCFFANKLHRIVFFFGMAAALIPTVLVTVSLYYLCFQVTADQIGLPDAVGHHLVPASKKVFGIVMGATPFVILIILICIYKVTHQIVGPFDRIVRELDECLKGKRKPPIMIRKSDKFRPMVDNINRLLQRLEKT